MPRGIGIQTSPRDGDFVAVEATAIEVFIHAIDSVATDEYNTALDLLIERECQHGSCFEGCPDMIDALRCILATTLAENQGVRSNQPRTVVRVMERLLTWDEHRFCVLDSDYEVKEEVNWFRLVNPLLRLRKHESVTVRRKIRRYTRLLTSPNCY